MAGYDFSGSSFFSDWSSIRNGSYKRLMKSYYGASATGGASKSGTAQTNNVLDRILEEKKNPKVSESTVQANAALVSGVSGLQSSLNTLQKEDTYTEKDGKTAQERQASALKDFVTSYNNTVSAAKKSNNTGMTTNVAGMMQATSEHKDELEGMGIYQNTDGTLRFIEAKAKAADTQAVSDLFSKDSVTSYGSVVASRLTRAGYYSESAPTQVQKEVENTSSTVSTSTDLAGDITALKGSDLFKTTTDADGKAVYDVDAITSRISSFAKNYNALISSARLLTNEGVTANLSNMLNKTKENASALKEFGITADKNGNLTVDEKTLRSADMAKVQKTMKSYVSSIENNASLISYYVKTNANVTNGYNANGSYTTYTGSGYNGII